MSGRICLVATLFCAGAAHALTADEVVQKNVEARGGLEKMRALRSLRLTGKVLFGSEDSPIEAQYAQRDGSSPRSADGAIRSAPRRTTPRSWPSLPISTGRSSTGRRRATASRFSAPKTWTAPRR